MKDPAIIELIQAGIDGELDDAGRAELDRLLAGSEDARRIHGELAAVANWLDRAEPLEPPADLHARIVSSIELPAPRRRGFSFGRMGSPLGYGLAAAAGVVLTLGVLGQRAPMGAADTHGLSGTMAPLESAAEVATRRFAYADGQGEVRLTRVPDGYRLDMALDNEVPAAWQLDLGASGLVLDSLARQQGAPDRVDWRGGIVSGAPQTTVRWFAILHATGATGTVAAEQINIRLYRDEAPVYTGSLDPTDN